MKRVQVLPKAKDAERSLTEQEAKGRQQSQTPVKTACVRSASGLSCSEQNEPSDIAGNHLHHTYVRQVTPYQRKRKIAFLPRADISVSRTTCP